MLNRLKAFVFVFVMFVGVADSYADELVRYNADDGNCRGTIIRHYGEKSDIVCVHSAGMSYFIFLQEGVPFTYARQVNLDTVCEFEIYNDTVYFCGMRTSSGISSAVLGYFDIASLASNATTVVYYQDLPWMDKANKLEVAWFAARKHVVAIGRERKGGAMIVDAIDEGTYWNVNYTGMYNDSLQLADLAITNSYVVVTSVLDEEMGSGSGLLWWIGKPSVSGSSILPSWNVQYIRISDKITKYLVRTYDGDHIVTANSYWKNALGTARYSVVQYNAFSFIKRYDITESVVVSSELWDIMPEKDYGWADLLISDNIEQLGVRGVVYEVPLSVTANTVVVCSHVYDKVECTSLDFTRQNRHFVMSGSKAEDMIPYFFKYKNGHFGGGCFGVYCNQMIKYNIDFEQKEKNLSRSVVNMIPIPEVAGQKDYRVLQYCISENKADE